MSKLLSKTRQNDETRWESRRFLPDCKFFLALPLKIGYNKEAFMFNERVRLAIELAGVLELADETDSKSVGGNTVWVRPPSPAPIVPKWFLPLRYFLFCAAWPDINRRCLPRCLPIFSASGYPFTAYYDPARTPDSAGKTRQISVWGCTAQCHPPATVKNRCAQFARFSKIPRASRHGEFFCGVLFQIKRFYYFGLPQCFGAS